MKRRNAENTGFCCAHCGKSVRRLTNGSYRNHCPFCLYSVHVDNTPGDRSSTCGALMVPVAYVQHKKKGLQVVHECVQCGTKKLNKIAECTDLPDNIDILYSLPLLPRHTSSR